MNQKKQQKVVPHAYLQQSQLPSSISSLKVSQSNPQNSQNMHKIMLLMRQQIQISNNFYCNKMKKLLEEQAKQICMLRNKVVENERELFRKNSIIQQFRTTMSNNNSQVQYIVNTNQVERQRSQAKKKLVVTSTQPQQTYHPNNKASNTSKTSQKIQQLQQKLQTIQANIGQKHKLQKQLNKKLEYFEKVTIKYFASRLSSCVNKLDKYMIKKQQQIERVYGQFQQLVRMCQEHGISLHENRTNQTNKNVNNNRQLQLSPIKTINTSCNPMSPLSTSSLSPSPSPSVSYTKNSIGNTVSNNKNTRSGTTAISSKMTKMIRQVQQIKMQISQIKAKEYTYDNCQVEKLRDQIAKIKKYLNYHENVAKAKQEQMSYVNNIITNEKSKIIYKSNHPSSQQLIKDHNFISNNSNLTINNNNSQAYNMDVNLIKSQKIIARRDNHPNVINSGNTINTGFNTGANGSRSINISQSTNDLPTINYNNGTNTSSRTHINSNTNGVATNMNQQIRINNKGYQHQGTQNMARNVPANIHMQYANHAQDHQNYNLHISNQASKLIKTANLASTSATHYLNHNPNRNNRNNQNKDGHDNNQASMNYAIQNGGPHHNLFKQLQPDRSKSIQNTRNNNGSVKDLRNTQINKKLQDQFYDNISQSQLQKLSKQESLEYQVQQSLCQEYQQQYTSEENLTDEQQEQSYMQISNEQRLLDTVKQQRLNLPVLVQIDQTGYLKCISNGMYLVDANDDGFELGQDQIACLTKKGIIRVGYCAN